MCLLFKLAISETVARTRNRMSPCVPEYKLMREVSCREVERYSSLLTGIEEVSFIICSIWRRFRRGAWRRSPCAASD